MPKIQQKNYKEQEIIKLEENRPLQKSGHCDFKTNFKIAKTQKPNKKIPPKY